MPLPPPTFRARRRFGQNFLRDDAVISAIVSAINPKEGENLVEIGPGHAALTAPVLARCKKLTAIELDRDLVEQLTHDPFLKGLTVIEGDALKVDFDALAGGGKLRVFGNLPYNITSPIIFHLLSFTKIADMHFMLQKEVVERLAAAPHSKDYGRLTVMTRFYARVMPMLEVPNTAFIPRPKVTSAVVRLIPHDLDEETRALAPVLNTITTAAFSARRKTVHNALGKLFSKDALTACGVNPQDRPEDLSVELYIALARALSLKNA